MYIRENEEKESEKGEICLQDGSKNQGNCYQPENRIIRKEGTERVEEKKWKKNGEESGMR